MWDLYAQVRAAENAQLDVDMCVAPPLSCMCVCARVYTPHTHTLALTHTHTHTHTHIHTYTHTWTRSPRRDVGPLRTSARGGERPTRRRHVLAPPPLRAAEECLTKSTRGYESDCARMCYESARSLSISLSISLVLSRSLSISLDLSRSCTNVAVSTLPHARLDVDMCAQPLPPPPLCCPPSCRLKGPPCPPKPRAIYIYIYTYTYTFMYLYVHTHTHTFFPIIIV